MRGFGALKQFHYKGAHATFEIKGRRRAVATVSKPLSTGRKAVQEARHLALPMIAGGVVIAALYFGRVLFITALVAIMIAFILEPFVALLVRARFPRSLAAFLVCTVALLGLYVTGIGA